MVPGAIDLEAAFDHAKGGDAWATPSFARRVSGVDDFLTTIATQPSRCAMLVIDIQDAYCLNAERPVKVVSERILDSLPAIRDAGVSIYQVVMNNNYIVADRDDDYQVPPELRDARIEKPCASAFDDSFLADSLTARGHDHLLLCGIYLTACVQASYIDALGGDYGHFNAMLLSDLSTNQNGTTIDDVREIYSNMWQYGGHAGNSRRLFNQLTSISATP